MFNLVEEAMPQILAELDPHSSYIPAKDLEAVNSDLKGSFSGIGVQFTIQDDTIHINSVIQGGPSEKVGLLAGDRIVAVNDSAIAGVKMSTEDIMSRLRGPKDSEVKLTIVRRGVDDQLYFTVKRDKIPILSLDASYMIQPKTGYIRINRFGATTAEEFAEALKSLQKKGMKDLILDLQGNGGGYLNAAIDLANEFLKQKELIVYTEGRAARRSDFFAKGTGNFKNGRLIVLVDEYSASASEIVTGAIQDWDRGVIVGRRTFGKGLVQRPIDLPDGSMIRLTIARYYTPSGRCIQKPYDSTANLDNGNFCLISCKIAVETILNFICDVRDYLHGTAAVIATALALQYAPVNLSSGNIGIAGEAFIDKALIVTKIKISLSAVIGDKHLSVLNRVHSSWVNVDIRVEFLHGNGVAARL